MIRFIYRIFQSLQQLYYVNIRQQKSNYFRIPIPFRHYLILFCILSLCIAGNIATKYQRFLDLKQGSSFEATIIWHYTKPNKSERFKLQDDQGNVLYASYKGKFKPLAGKRARVYGKIYRCSFLQFLKSCNIYNSTLSLIPHTEKKRVLRHFINQQHEFPLAANLYNALFFADHLEKPLRQSSVALGLAHLIAISGFHLAVLSLMFYALICPIYFLFHRYFCYRNAVYDLGFLGLIFAFCYLVLIDYEPSFFRAFIMACFAYIILLCGLEITNFCNLLFCVLLALAWNASLVLHIGFLLSVSGVFFIFLFIRHIGSALAQYCWWHKILLGTLLFDCIIFVQMIPVVHFFFPDFSPYQLVSIPLSIGFFILFPLVIVAHIFGVGNLFDSVIMRVVEHEFFLSSLVTPWYVLVGYIGVCLLAMRYAWAYLASIFCAVLFYVVNLVVYYQAYSQSVA